MVRACSLLGVGAESTTIDPRSEEDEDEEELELLGEPSFSVGVHKFSKHYVSR